MEKSQIEAALQSDKGPSAASAPGPASESVIPKERCCVVQNRPERKCAALNG